MTQEKSALAGIRYKPELKKFEARICIKGVQHSKVFSTANEASTWRQMMFDKKDSVCFLTFDDVIAGWLEKLANESEYSPQTLRLYKGGLKVHLLPFFKGRKVKEITEIDIIDFAVQLKAKKHKGKHISSKTVKNIVGSLSNFFEYCEFRKCISINPVATDAFRQKLKRLVKDHRNFEQNIRKKARTPEELGLLLQMTAQKGIEFGLATEFLLSTAFRLGEGAAITWGDIIQTTHPISRAPNLIVTVNKTRDHRSKMVQKKAKWGSDGIVSISQTLFEKLMAFKLWLTQTGHDIGNTDPIFPNIAKNQMGYSEALGTLSEKIGIRRTTAHCLRHSTITFLAANGHPIQEIQSLARHSSLGITSSYMNAGHLQHTSMTNSLERLTSQFIPTENLG